MRWKWCGSERACRALVAALCMLAIGGFLAGCQNGESPSVDEGTTLLKEMKTWFEATDYEASGYASLEEALDDIYQDDGYTASLYRDIDDALKQTGSGTTPPATLMKECQEWFELIDYEMSGYASLDEAIKDIYSDGEETLSLYKRIVEYNEAAAE